MCSSGLGEALSYPDLNPAGQQIPSINNKWSSRRAMLSRIVIFMLLSTGTSVCREISKYDAVARVISYPYAVVNNCLLVFISSMIFCQLL